MHKKWINKCKKCIKSVKETKETCIKSASKLLKETSEGLVFQNTQNLTAKTHLVQPCSRPKEGQDLTQRLQCRRGQNKDQLVTRQAIKSHTWVTWSYLSQCWNSNYTHEKDPQSATYTWTCLGKSG